MVIIIKGIHLYQWWLAVGFGHVINHTLMRYDGSYILTSADMDVYNRFGVP